jgi:heptosyltransferase-1
LHYAVDEPPDFLLEAPAAASPAWLPQQPYVVFFHCASRAAKRWDDANWLQLANALAPGAWPVLLPWGSEDERQDALRLAAQMKNARVLPRLNIAEAALLAQRASLVVGVDSGLTHIAAAFFRPTIELYCDSARWKTEGNWSENIINLGDAGRPPDVAEVEQLALGFLQQEHPSAEKPST